ncbi:histone-lysine N-methyltransferase SETMAR-like [Lineus longissimus]|uniref:histone-lysine N-methyltransferase SETMAR-like n=1 Tax=Lineus longissimus TaxID=88925 RepID=UPI00315D6931
MCDDMEHTDLSKGIEQCAIKSEIGQELALAAFTYVKCNILGPGTSTEHFEEEFEGCDCSNRCHEDCPCLGRFGPTYAHDGRILEIAVSSTTAKPIYECSKNCRCPQECPNRVVQFGVQTKFIVFRTSWKGLGLKTAEDIPKFRFVCEYAGEILTMLEAKRRTEISHETNAMNYILVLREILPNLGTVETCVDPSAMGNVGRFINHSCAPNLIMFPVRVDNNVPKLCLFAARDINSGEELTFDYSGEFRLNNGATSIEASLASADDMTDVPDCDITSKRKPCYCGASSCRGFLPYDPSLY